MRSAFARSLGGLVGVGGAAVLGLEGVDLLVDHRVEEHGEDRRGRSVDRHRHRGGRGAQVEAVVEHLHVVEGADRHAGVADLAVDVGSLGRVEAVQGDRVEGGGEPGGRRVLGQEVEAAVGAEGVALAGEHAGRVLVVALEREHPGGEREAAGQVLGAHEGDQVAVVGEGRHRDSWHEGARQRHAGLLG